MIHVLDEHSLYAHSVVYLAVLFKSVIFFMDIYPGAYLEGAEPALPH